MIDIPLGKALAPVETDIQSCPSCYFYNMRYCFENIACYPETCKDGKNVIFTLVDYPVKEEK